MTEWLCWTPCLILAHMWWGLLSTLKKHFHYFQCIFKWNNWTRVYFKNWTLIKLDNPGKCSLQEWVLVLIISHILVTSWGLWWLSCQSPHCSCRTVDPFRSDTVKFTKQNTLIQTYVCSHTPYTINHVGRRMNGLCTHHVLPKQTPPQTTKCRTHVPMIYGLWKLMIKHIYWERERERERCIN